MIILKTPASDIYKKLVAAAMLLLAVPTSAVAQEFIEIVQAKSQKKLQAQVVQIADGKITFKTKNGKKYTVGVDQISDASIEKAKQSLAKQAAKSEKIYTDINAVIGYTLFEGAGGLWNQEAGDVAGRLRWPKESVTEYSSSYRYYPRMSYQFLGAHPYSATLYGDKEGKTSHLSLVFANKGDFGSTAGSGEDHFKKMHPEKKPPMSLNEAIEMDAEIISEALTKALGKPKKQYYGEKEDRRRVLRWNLEDHAFLLSEVEGEYTGLMIVTKENADLLGKVAMVKDSDLKKILLKNVVKGEHGDTVIKNIPMVDQGPKGYCAPATFERAMRYMFVPADMYLLATVATAEGGGTNTLLLADGCKRIVRSKARRIKDLDLEKDLKMRRVKQYIDKGVPILWQMRSLDAYNKIANTRTRERRDLEDISAWRTSIQDEANRVVGSLENNNTNHHICMIIGYNEATQELAVSDSWGARYALRWVHIDIARAVTSRGGFVIDL